MKRTLLTLGAILALVLGGTAAFSLATDVTASCTQSPVVNETDSAQSFTIECSVPKPAPVTETVTVPGPTQTVTVTVTPKPSATPPSSTPTVTPTPSNTPPPSATPSSTPTAAPTTGCAPDPSACGYPDETNTGVPADAVLKTISGAFDCTSGCGAQGKGWHVERGSYIRVDQPNAVVSNIRTGYGLYIIAAPGAVVKNTEIAMSSYGGFAVQVRGDRGYASNNVTIQDSTLRNSNGGYETAIYDTGTTGLTVQRVDISGFGGGMQISSPFTLRDSYIHDLACKTSSGGACTGGGQDGHINGVQTSGGGGATIVHNTIFNPHPQTDAVMLTNDFGQPQKDDLVQDNLLAGGGYTIYGGNTGSGGACGGACTNIRITNNRIARTYYPGGGFYGWMTAQAPGSSNVTSGNVWDDTGKPISN